MKNDFFDVILFRRYFTSLLFLRSNKLINRCPIWWAWKLSLNETQTFQRKRKLKKSFDSYFLSAKATYFLPLWALFLGLFLCIKSSTNRRIETQLLNYIMPDERCCIWYRRVHCFVSSVVHSQMLKCIEINGCCNTRITVLTVN